MRVFIDTLSSEVSVTRDTHYCTKSIKRIDTRSRNDVNFHYKILQLHFIKYIVYFIKYIRLQITTLVLSAVIQFKIIFTRKIRNVRSSITVKIPSSYLVFITQFVCNSKALNRLTCTATDKIYVFNLIQMKSVKLQCISCLVFACNGRAMMS